MSAFILFFIEVVSRFHLPPSWIFVNSNGLKPRQAALYLFHYTPSLRKLPRISVSWAASAMLEQWIRRGDGTVRTFVFQWDNTVKVGTKCMAFNMKDVRESAFLRLKWNCHLNKHTSLCRNENSLCRGLTSAQVLFNAATRTRCPQGVKRDWCKMPLPHVQWMYWNM